MQTIWETGLEQNSLEQNLSFQGVWSRRHGIAFSSWELSLNIMVDKVFSLTEIVQQYYNCP